MSLLEPIAQEDRHKLSMTVLASPDMANFSGNVHGGQLLRLLDQVAYSCASRYAGQYAVTLSLDNVMFKQPVKVGELLNLYATVNYVGNTSMEIGIKVIAENVNTHERRHTNTCYFTMVALGEDKRPIKIPKFEPRTEDEKRRFEAAKLRKALKKELDARYKQIADEMGEED